MNWKFILIVIAVYVGLALLGENGANELLLQLIDFVRTIPGIIGVFPQ